MLTKEFLVEKLKEFEIEKDSILMVHSSLKALGPIDGGAETVISVVEETVKDGTLVFSRTSDNRLGTCHQGGLAS